MSSTSVLETGSKTSTFSFCFAMELLYNEGNVLAGIVGSLWYEFLDFLNRQALATVKATLC